MYFDYTATTPMDSEVLETYVTIQKKYYANTTSLHLLGLKANSIYEQMKDEIRQILNVSHDIAFTSNATEANNLAIFGVVEGRKGKIITTKIEHPSVFNVYQKLEEDGFDVVYLNVDKNGIIDLNELKREMSNDVLLVSIMWVNNIIGAIEPIGEVIKIVKEYKHCKLHVDAVQGITKIKPDFNFEDIDLLTMSAHKFYGPKGIGILAYKKNMVLSKRLYGSNAQNGVKPGTFDLGLVVCATKALKKYMNLINENFNYVMTLNNYLRNNLTNNKIVINSNLACSPYIFNISIPGYKGETIVHMLEEKDIYVSTGSSCSSKLVKPEKTIFAITNSEEYARTSIRISLSYLTIQEEVEELVKTLNQL